MLPASDTLRSALLGSRSLPSHRADAPGAGTAIRHATLGGPGAAPPPLAPGRIHAECVAGAPPSLRSSDKLTSRPPGPLQPCDQEVARPDPDRARLIRRICEQDVLLRGLLLRAEELRDQRPHECLEQIAELEARLLCGHIAPAVTDPSPAPALGDPPAEAPPEVPVSEEEGSLAEADTTTIGIEDWPLPPGLPPGARVAGFCRVEYDARAFAPQPTEAAPQDPPTPQPHSYPVILSNALVLPSPNYPVSAPVQQGFLRSVYPVTWPPTDMARAGLLAPKKLFSRSQRAQRAFAHPSHLLQ
mmetsp:Transcript_25589/g.73925  ORF Transcript_25589/g.73925 Transcript_25589/m.73925 type:complete len:301 (+) Transcript_25589:71-973(+)